MEFGRRSHVSRGRVVAVGHGFALISLVLCAVLLSPGSATAATGSIPGEFSVAPTGSATYTIPISVPPGLGGTQPNIAIQYNSQATNGWLGVGWNLSGLSEIRRCPQTYAQDNNWRGIAFDSGDRFCLDGQRLVAVAGEYGAGGTEYRSENDGYTKIVQSAGDCSGPCGFTVSTKSGDSIKESNEMGKNWDYDGYIRKVGTYGDWDFKNRVEYRDLPGVEEFGNFAFGATSQAWADGATRGLSASFPNLATNLMTFTPL